MKKTTERNLNQITLEGTTFLIDVPSEQLIQKDQPDNKIDYKDMNFKQGYYELYYDPTTRNIQVPFEECPQMVRIGIATLFETDEKAMLNKYNLTVNPITSRMKEILKNHEWFILKRLNGDLPMLQLNNNFYELDVAKGIIRPLYRNEPDIALKNFRLTDDGKSLVCLIERSSGKAFPVGTDLKNLPDTIWMVEMPLLSESDPIGMARLNRQHDLSQIWDHPPQEIVTCNFQRVSNKRALPRVKEQKQAKVRPAKGKSKKI